MGIKADGKRTSLSLFVICCCIGYHLTTINLVNAHGYIKSPRSRNLLAYEDTVWWPLTANDPEPETCPHCLNRGGVRAQCGISEDSQSIRNYDMPKNALGGQMPTMIQATYTQGQEVILDVVLTAHHKGHFVFSGCPISPGEIPTKECFDKYPLTFVEDMLHNANYDPNYPERAYLAPVDDPNYVPVVGSTRTIMEYSFKMRLPYDLWGDLVLIQWYYLTANSCYHEGYQEYDWPDGWDGATSSMPCGEVSSDGTGVPEQFWNCAETKILHDPNAAFIPVPAPPVVNNFEVPVSTPQEFTSGVSIPVSLPSSSLETSYSSAGSHGKTIVGYYASWQWYDRNKLAAPENMDFTKVQRVNFAFFQIDTQGNMWGTDAWADPNLLFGPYDWNPGEGSKKYCSWDSATEKACNTHNYEEGLIHLVHAAGAEIYPSLGGWTLSDAFVGMAASATARARFTQNCVDLIKEYNFDGIDIDWEYPGFAEHSGTPQDRENFKLLLNDVRAALDKLGAETGRYYGLTAALPCGPSHIENMDIAHVASTLTELNLMTYDFHGAFSATSGINAPLFPQGWGEEDFDVHSCVKNWLKGGGSREKINIGLPFYGRSVGGATGLNQPHTGADQAVWGVDDGTPQYFNIVEQLPFMTSVWDEKTWTQYASFSDGGFVSFDNENAICSKVQYAIDHNLGGFIIWELSGDLMEDLSTPLLDVTNKKLHNPDYNCGEPGIYPEEGVALPPESSSGTDVFPNTNPTPVQSQPTPAVTNPTVQAPPTFVTNPAPSSHQSVGFPVGGQSVNTAEEQVSEPPLVFRCGEQQSPFDTADSKSLDLSFKYELHKDSGASVTETLREVKSSMLNSISEQLNCAAASSVVRKRMLRTLQALVSSQNNVRVIESKQADLPQNGVECSIPLNLDASTCHSVVGSMTAKFDKDTPPEVLNEVMEELLFFIRTSMASGRWESAKVKKVIYIENLAANPLESNTGPANANIVWQPQNESGNTTTIIAVVMSLLVIVLFGVLLFVFVTRRKRRRSATNRVEEHTIAVAKLDCSESTSVPMSTEETWKKALDTEEAWKKALNAYDSERKTSRFDIDSDEEEADSSGSKAVSVMQPSDDKMTTELGNGDDKDIYSAAKQDESVSNEETTTVANEPARSQEDLIEEGGDNGDENDAKDKTPKDNAKRRRSSKAAEEANDDLPEVLQSMNKALEDAKSNMDDMKTARSIRWEAHSPEDENTTIQDID